MSDHCRLCGSGGDLDFHHWQYSDDTGCLLCRDCHSYIHEPDGARPREGPGNEWVEHALRRLLERHSTHRPFIRAPEKVVEHYSLPEKYHPRVSQLLKDAL